MLWQMPYVMVFADYLLLVQLNINFISNYVVINCKSELMKTDELPCEDT